MNEASAALHAVRDAMQFLSPNMLPYFPFVEYGSEFAHPDDIAPAKIVKQLTRGRVFRPQQCYKNSQLIMCDNPGNRALRYYEGYFAFPDHYVPLHHAWVTYNGKLIDVTLDAVERRWPESAERLRRHVYVGVHIPFRFVELHMMETETHSPLTDNPRMLRKLYKEKPSWLTKQRKTSTL